MKKSITIIDTFGFLFRSYFALPPLRSKDGFPTGLLTGFINFIANIGKDFQTDYIVFALDAKGDTFRNELYDAYKAQRPAVPEDLLVWMPIISVLLSIKNPTVKTNHIESIGTIIFFSFFMMQLSSQINFETAIHLLCHLRE